MITLCILFDPHINQELLDKFQRLFGTHPWIELTIHPRLATHFILMNTTRLPPEVEPYVDPSHVLGLAREPLPFLQMDTSYIQYVRDHVGTYYIGQSHSSLPSMFQSFMAFMTSQPLSIPVPLWKPKFASIIFSDKCLAPGHIYRHRLVQAILASNLPIDIYGRGCQHLGSTTFCNDSRVRGYFVPGSTVPYSEYMFHIAIENYQHDDYISEKITDALLLGCTPIYWGARNIHRVFPNMVHTLVGPNVTYHSKTKQSMCTRMNSSIAYDMDFLHRVYRNSWEYRLEPDAVQVRKTLDLWSHLVSMWGPIVEPEPEPSISP